MKVRIELGEAEIRDLVAKFLREQLGPEFTLANADVLIQVKSKQNYRSEWETAAFRAVYER